MRHARTLGPLALVALAGCATYRPLPLDSAAVEAGLQPPPADSVAVVAARTDNPLLLPLSFDASDGLSPDEAAVLAVVANPELRAARTQRGVAGAELIAAGVLPNPQLSGVAEVPVHDATGATTATGLGLSLDLNEFFTRGPEKAAARAALQSVQLDLAWQEWQVAQQARLQTYRVLFLQRQLAIALEEEESLRSNRDRLGRARAEHLVPDTESAAATDAFRTARDASLELGGELESARHELNRALGLPAADAVVLQTEGVPFLPVSAGSDSVGAAVGLPIELIDSTVVSDDDLVAGLERRRLDLAALRMGYESEEESLRAAVRRAFPRVNLGVNRLVDASKLLAWGYALTLDLPFFDRNQGEIAIGRATREQLHAEYVARVFAARADVADLRQQIVHVRRRLDNAEESLPELDRLVAIYGRALQEGTVDALLYYDARTRRTDKQLEILRLRQALAELAVGLDTATGGFRTASATTEG